MDPHHAEIARNLEMLYARCWLGGWRMTESDAEWLRRAIYELTKQPDSAEPRPDSERQQCIDQRADEGR